MEGMTLTNPGGNLSPASKSTPKKRSRSLLALNQPLHLLRLIAKSAQRRNKLLLLKLASSIQVVNRWNNEILQFIDGTEERKNRRIGF